MTLNKKPIRAAIHWNRFGPYHIARLIAAFQELKPVGIQIVGLEIAKRDQTYSWRQENAQAIFERYIALPGQTLGRFSWIEIWRGVKSALNEINPDIVAIAGYSEPAAWSILIWCKLHHRPMILMTDSKWDDAARSSWKEWLKRGLVCQFSAALCAGYPHRAYLKYLGMKPDRIFEGVDVVDNDYFWKRACQVRQNPTAYRVLPGLEPSEPFFLASARFIKRKNIDGLLRAYAQYRKHMIIDDCKNGPWRLVILGDGVERNALEHLLVVERIQGVSFPGFRQIDELPLYYGLASAFIHPAKQEQWGLVVNEAMASGLPVLVSDRCGCASDLIREGSNGFTFKPEDEAALARLMALISSKQVNLRAMGQASRERIAEWGLNRFVWGLHKALMAAQKGREGIRSI